MFLQKSLKSRQLKTFWVVSQDKQRMQSLIGCESTENLLLKRVSHSVWPNPNGSAEPSVDYGRTPNMKKMSFWLKKKLPFSVKLLSMCQKFQSQVFAL